MNYVMKYDKKEKGRILKRMQFKLNKFQFKYHRLSFYFAYHYHHYRSSLIFRQRTVKYQAMIDRWVVKGFLFFFLKFVSFQL